jgi:hypothetical protein
MYYAGTTATDIYLGLRISSPQLAANTTIVLTLSKNDLTTGATDDWKIHIRPGNVGTSGHPTAVMYWRDSSGSGSGSGSGSSGVAWNSGVAPAGVAIAAAAGDWLIDNVFFSDQGVNGWQLEMRIPRASSAGAAGSGSTQGVYFPPSSKFRMYVNVLSTSSITGTYQQDPWPAGVVIQPAASNLLEKLTPDKPNWGVVSLYPRSECKGVSLAWNAIGVKDASSAIGQKIKLLSPPAGGYPGTDFDGNGVKDIHDCQALSDNYNWPAPQGGVNTFIARPTSTMPTDGKVNATFYVASWGIPGVTDWKKTGELYPVAGGVTNNPTSELPIPANGFVNLESEWTLSFKQSCTYALSNSGHHCIQVDLDSSDVNTVLLNRSAQRNMDFVTASVFQRSATISTNGLAKPPVGQSAHDYLLTVETARQRYTYDKPYYYPIRDNKNQMNSFLMQRIPEHYYGKGLTEALIWIARGYVKTGDKLVINKEPYIYARRTGSFGYVVGHAGEVTDWSMELKNADPKGPRLEKVGSTNAYSIKIPPETSVSLETRVEAKEPSVCVSTPCQPCPNIKVGKNDSLEFPGALVLFGCIGGLGGLVFRKRRKDRKDDR